MGVVLRKLYVWVVISIVLIAGCAKGNFGLRLRCHVVVVMMFVVVMRSNGNAAANQGEAAKGGQSGFVHRIRRKGLCCRNFCCEFMFAKGSDGVVVQPTVRLYTNQCALSLAEVVFNY